MSKTLLTPERLQRMIHVINEQRTWIIALYNPKQVPYLRLMTNEVADTQTYYDYDTNDSHRLRF